MSEHHHTALTPEELEHVHAEFDYIMQRFLPKYKQYHAEKNLMGALECDLEFAEDGMLLMTLGDKIGISDFGAYMLEQLEQS